MENCELTITSGFLFLAGSLHSANRFHVSTLYWIVKHKNEYPVDLQTIRFYHQSCLSDFNRFKIHCFGVGLACAKWFCETENFITVWASLEEKKTTEHNRRRCKYKIMDEIENIRGIVCTCIKRACQKNDEFQRIHFVFLFPFCSFWMQPYDRHCMRSTVEITKNSPTHAMHTHTGAKCISKVVTSFYHTTAYSESTKNCELIVFSSCEWISISRRLRNGRTNI